MDIDEVRQNIDPVIRRVYITKEKDILEKLEVVVMLLKELRKDKTKKPVKIHLIDVISSLRHTARDTYM